MLSINGVNAGYGDLHVLFDINMEVGAGEVVALVGSNGAGKTTLLRAISGLMPIQSGNIIFQGQDLAKVAAHDRAELGISHIPQGRGILRTVSVMDNLHLGAYSKHSKKNFKKNLEQVFSMFPILEERQKQMAGSLSGGEQQMLAIARSILMEPKMLMLDEPSLGLAPLIVDEVFGVIRQFRDIGISVLIIEQNLLQALKTASRGYVLETGHIFMEGGSEDLLNSKDIRKAYLGV
jgi:ABC-type branched-chain amino acid transport systems, ATPase component